MTETQDEPTYIETVVEARLNSTEKQETISKILKQFIEGEPFLDERYDGNFLVIRNSNVNALQIFGDWIREQRQLDTVRDRLIRSTRDNITALYFNRQAAAMGRIALVDINDNPPNGPIVLHIVSDGLMSIINEITPRTYKGSIITEDQWDRIKLKQEREKKKKARDIERDKKRKEKYH